jgi:hypothetical protein
VNVPLADGVPLRVIVFADHAAVTPAGRPVGVPIPVAPVVVCVILGKAELIHKVGVLEAGPTVLERVTVKVAVAIPAQPLVSVTVTV